MTEREIWQEPSISSEGLGVTTYSIAEGEGPEPTVEDESYWTWAELESLRGEAIDPEADD